MVIAGLWRYGDWRHVATGCNALVRLKPTCASCWITRKISQISVSRRVSLGIAWRTSESENTALTATNPIDSLWETKTTSYNNKNNNRFTARCPGLPGWAGTRTNTHPPTILVIIQSYQLLPFTTIHSILLVQITCLLGNPNRLVAFFLHNLFPNKSLNVNYRWKIILCA